MATWGKWIRIQLRLEPARQFELKEGLWCATDAPRSCMVQWEFFTPHLGRSIHAEATNKHPAIQSAARTYWRNYSHVLVVVAIPIILVPVFVRVVVTRISSILFFILVFPIVFLSIGVIIPVPTVVLEFAIVRQLVGEFVTAACIVPTIRQLSFTALQFAGKPNE